MALPPDNMTMIEAGVKLILLGLGEDPDREGLRDTPRRVATMYADILDGKYGKSPTLTTFEDETPEVLGAMVMTHHAPFYGFCEHHLSIFLGHFGIAYVPDGKLIGLSKMIRLFRHCTKRIGLQERITNQAADLMMEVVKPKGVIVYATAEHTCMSLRGVKSPGAHTTTIATRGIFMDNVELRQLFLNEASK